MNPGRLEKQIYNVTGTELWGLNLITGLKFSSTAYEDWLYSSMLISFIVVLFIETKCFNAGGYTFRDGPKSYFQFQQSKTLMVSHTEIYALNRLIQPELCMTLYCVVHTEQSCKCFFIHSWKRTLPHIPYISMNWNSSLLSNSILHENWNSQKLFSKRQNISNICGSKNHPNLLWFF